MSCERSSPSSTTYRLFAADFLLLALVAYRAAAMPGVDDVKDELESRWDELGEFIREQRRVGHLSLRKLSELAGISNPYLSQIERGLRRPSAEILQQIARALSISSETLYIRAGILEERTGTADLVGEILRDPYLNEDQKKTLVRVYDSFRHENGNTPGAPPPWTHRGLRRPDPRAPSKTGNDRAVPSVPPPLPWLVSRCCRCTPRRWPNRGLATVGG
jgi:transcriptional regulator with XRE-family HTH domain